MARKNQNRSDCKNSPNKVRNSLLNYIKHEFPYQQDWTHPVTGEVYTSEVIRQNIERFKDGNPQGYKALWILFTTSATRTFIAYRMLISTSTLRRIWDDAIDTLLLMLIYPNLIPDRVNIYDIH